ncbi:MAG: ribonuclease P protein component [Methylophilales bacterium]|nr:ribonuclease P protein component [Methylophilales bacterium]
MAEDIGLGFPGGLKLKKTDEFSSVFSFRRRIHGKFLAIHHMPNNLGYPRIGVVVSKKLARRAVARNYMKRVVRELFRLNRLNIGAVDIVVRISQSFSKLDFVSVMREFELALTKLPQNKITKSQ